MTTMHVLMHQECYEGAAVIAVSDSAEKLEAKRLGLLALSSLPILDVPEELRHFRYVKPDELFLDTVEVL